jgi:hypothetical protein
MLQHVLPTTTRSLRPRLAGHLACLLAIGLTATLVAQDTWFVSPRGKSVAEGGAGTIDNPWDLRSALSDPTRIGPGDTLYLLGGTYLADRNHPQTPGAFRLRLSGSDAAGLVIRNYGNQRATIDGGLLLDDAAQGNHVTIQGLELLVSERRDPATRDLTAPGASLVGPQGGITVHYGRNVRLINNIIHAAGTGISAWRLLDGLELYGNVVYDNGYFDHVRYHGPGFYSQNDQANQVRQIRNNFFLENYSNAIQIYGSSTAQVHNFHVASNIISSFPDSGRNVALLGGAGGADNPSTNLHATGNILYDTQIQLGFGSGHGDNLSATDNTLYRGHVAQAGTLTQVTVQNNRTWNDGDAIPPAPRVFLQENIYDPQRAHLAVFQWGDASHVAVDLSGFLDVGQKYQILDPRDFFGAPLLHGVFDGSPVPVPVPGEFGAYIILAQPAPEPGSAP